MNLEVLFFRLALAISVTGAVLSGGYAAYSYYQVQSWRETMQLNHEQVSRCSGGGNDYHCILPIEDLQGKYEASVKISVWYLQQTILLLHLTWLIPVLALSIFYSLRWLILGRLSPIWPAGDRQGG